MSNRMIQWLVAAIVLACLAGVVMIAAYEALSVRPANVAENEEKSPPPVAALTGEVENDGEETAAADSHLIDDDGKTLWASPTSGPALDLAYLPPGCQLIVATRPETLGKHGEFTKIRDAMGPRVLDTAALLDSALFTPMGVGRAIFGWRIARDGKWELTVVAHLSGSRSASEHMAVKLPNAVRKSHRGQTYWVEDPWAYYLPDVADPRLLVVGSPEGIKEVIELDGNPPPLRRDIERLLAHTDADRQVTLIFAPNFLFSEGQGIFVGEYARLREALFWFLGDSLSAAALSLNWDENFFVELLAVPTLDTRPAEAARQLAERVAQMSDLVEDHVQRLEPQPYGREIVARFPAMVRKLAAYVRTGVEEDHVVMRCYLPAVAGHNLIMGAELALAETPAARAGKARSIPVTDSGDLGSTGLAEVGRGEATSPAGERSVREAMARRMSLKTARDSLEAVLHLWSEVAGVEVVMIGPDLQADGITRNQQLAIDVADRRAEEILVEILRLANPDKSVSGPADARQKLVYVAKSKEPGGPEAIFVTTRARATERGETLPEIFTQRVKPQ